jgi:hypothetical protein
LYFPKVPPSERDGLRRLVALSDDQLGRLATALEAAEPVLARGEFLRSIEIAGDAESVRRAVGALMFIHSFLTVGDIKDDRLIASILASLRMEDGFEEQELERLAAVLPRFLSITSLRLRAKAVDLRFDHAKVLQSARILTDCRPVFAPGPGYEITGALICHTLKLEYYSAEGTREVYIAVDERDLAEIGRLIERADSKAAALKKLVFEDRRLKGFGTLDGKFYDPPDAEDGD